LFIGGCGGALSQISRLSFPNYSVGVQLEPPLKNRAARAEVICKQLSVRQQQIRLQQLEKQVTLEITNAMIAVEEAGASYEASVHRVLQQQTLDAEREKVERFHVIVLDSISTRSSRGLIGGSIRGKQLSQGENSVAARRRIDSRRLRCRYDGSPDGLRISPERSGPPLSSNE
jgi:hypothetical protein